MREAWAGRQFGTAAFAAPVALAPRRPKAKFELAVDLGRDLFTPHWWRGLATLTGMTVALALLAPSFGPLPAGTPPRASIAERAEWQAAGVGSLGSGSDSGLRMVATGAVEPIARAPERASVQLFATLGADGLARSLARLGAATGDAATAQALLRSAALRPEPGAAIEIVLGRRGAGGRRPLEQLAMRAAIDMDIRIARGEQGLSLTRIPIAVDRTPLRIRGRVGNGLYWALRTAGVSSEAAVQYLKAVAAEIDVGEIGPDDRFDLILANRRAAGGESRAGALLYAGLDRALDRDLQLIRWNSGGKLLWIDAANAGQARPAGDAMVWPVAARITSGFGMRRHPILRFARMHRGIDFGAGHGTPIVAAAAGEVTRAGWGGGYGRQVRIAHAGGLASSYSHMSRMIVAPGMHVSQGQVIGYVGSSGLSTGPHLHYEVYRGGQAVDPMSVRFTAAPGIDPRTASAVRARLKELMAVGTKG